MSARPSNAYGVNRGIRSSSAGVSRADCGGISQPTRRRYKSTAIRSSISAVTFGRARARTSHLPSSGLVVISYLSSTWGRADQQTSHDSIESGAFCFARYFCEPLCRAGAATALAGLRVADAGNKSGLSEARWSIRFARILKNAPTFQRTAQPTSTIARKTIARNQLSEAAPVLRITHRRPERGNVRAGRLTRP